MSRPTALAVRDVVITIAAAIAVAFIGGPIGEAQRPATMHTGLIAIPIALGVLAALALIVALAAHLIVRKRGGL